MRIKKEISLGLAPVNKERVKKNKSDVARWTKNKSNLARWAFDVEGGHKGGATGAVFLKVLAVAALCEEDTEVALMGCGVARRSFLDEISYAIFTCIAHQRPCFAFKHYQKTNIFQSYRHIFISKTTLWLSRHKKPQPIKTNSAVFVKIHIEFKV